MTAGDSISVNCSPHANPPANITWLRNGIPLTNGMWIVIVLLFESGFAWHCLLGLNLRLLAGTSLQCQDFA